MLSNAGEALFIMEGNGAGTHLIKHIKYGPSVSQSAYTSHDYYSVANMGSGASERTTSTSALCGKTDSGGASSSSTTGAASGNTANNTAANASAAHENMPPYKVVNIWERTA